MDKKVTISDLLEAKRAGRKITSVSCYDYTTARLVADAGVEMILVGDSAAQVLLGHENTLPVTMDFMVTITAAVRRAAPNVCLVADMPFLSYQTCIADAVRNAGRFFQEAGVQIVKIEATASHLDVIKAISDAGMAVMAHIGIRPQQIAKLGKLKAEGTTADHAFELVALANKMVDRIQPGSGDQLRQRSGLRWPDSYHLGHSGAWQREKAKIRKSLCTVRRADQAGHCDVCRAGPKQSISFG